jgi:cytochrome o ubiquinol oxidase operon protein cyoD
MNTHPSNSDYFAEIGFWPNGSGARSYILGFTGSIVLTLIPFIMLEIHVGSHHTVFSHATLIAAAVACALLQFFVQIACFLHLAGKGVSRERRAMFAAAAAVVFILVAGSLWIMTSLNGRMMMTPAEMMQYMQSQSSF